MVDNPMVRYRAIVREQIAYHKNKLMELEAELAEVDRLLGDSDGK